MAKLMTEESRRQWITKFPSEWIESLILVGAQQTQIIVDRPSSTKEKLDVARVLYDAMVETIKGGEENRKDNASSVVEET